MLILKVLSVVLNYPEAETLAALDEMADIVKREQLLPKQAKSAVLALFEAYRGEALLALQEQYVNLFDRGRFLSLHIFEHVHGESRERGQAMVNLLEMYESHGFQLNAQELPDYIPLFLEFLAQLNQHEARQLLQDAMPVLALLGARLTERGSYYAAVFDALAAFAGEPDELADIRRQAASEGEDETLVNLDAIWEEEMISFLGAGDTCQSQHGKISTVTVLPRD